MKYEYKDYEKKKLPKESEMIHKDMKKNTQKGMNQNSRRNDSQRVWKGSQRVWKAPKESEKAHIEYEQLHKESEQANKSLNPLIMSVIRLRKSCKSPNRLE